MAKTNIETALSLAQKMAKFEELLRELESGSCLAVVARAPRDRVISVPSDLCTRAGRSIIQITTNALIEKMRECNTGLKTIVSVIENDLTELAATEDG